MINDQQNTFLFVKNDRNLEVSNFDFGQIYLKIFPNFIVNLVNFQGKIDMQQKIEEAIHAGKTILGLKSHFDQLVLPFTISNRGYDNIDRYLTVPNPPRLIGQISVVESQLKIPDLGNERQIWHFETIKKQKHHPLHPLHFRIKNTGKMNQTGKNLYLTLAQNKDIDGYLVQLAEIDQKNKHQIWYLGLGQNLRFTIKNSSHGEQLFLDSVENENLPQGYKNVLICQSQTGPKRKYLQLWKISPVKETLTPVHLVQTENHNGQVIKLSPQIEHPYLQNFGGKLYKKKTPGYDLKTQQYATSSYQREQTEPYLLAVPKDVKDIVEIINLAKKIKKNVVARSGGHQYCGLSSGNQGTIVISMDNFNDILPPNKDGIVEIGPCVRLKVAAKHFREWKISLPTGQCPLVNIGGHAQTGGYGWFIHSFGLNCDYIQAFEIVLADGTHKKVYRPKPEANLKNKQQLDNLQLFRGVLGGNAGSFGIITRYFYKGIADEDHPNSYGFSKVRHFTKERLASVMKVFQEWSILVDHHEDDIQLKGLDIQLTVGQIFIEALGIKVPVLILQGLYSDPDKVPYNDQLKKIYEDFMKGETMIQYLTNLFLDRWQGKYPLSELAQRHVRKFPLVTLRGREFDLPYQKRANVTMSALTDKFIEQFVDQVSYVASPLRENHLVLVQMVIGGGAQRQKGKRKVKGRTVTSIPLRNYVHNFVYDIFYRPNNKDPNDKTNQNQAKQIQKKMQKTVDQHYSTPGYGEKRFFWGSFDVADMTDPKVINMYYDSPQDYAVLQQLKKKVDPDDVFHSIMTVKLPK